MAFCVAVVRSAAKARRGVFSVDDDLCGVGDVGGVGSDVAGTSSDVAGTGVAVLWTPAFGGGVVGGVS